MPFLTSMDWSPLGAHSNVWGAINLFPSGARKLGLLASGFTSLTVEFRFHGSCDSPCGK
jgi:hypothetical protein